MNYVSLLNASSCGCWCLAAFCSSSADSPSGCRAENSPVRRGPMFRGSLVALARRRTYAVKPLSSPSARRFPANPLDRQRINRADSFPVYPSRFVILVLRTGVLTIALSRPPQPVSRRVYSLFSKAQTPPFGDSSGDFGDSRRDFPGSSGITVEIPGPLNRHRFSSLQVTLFAKSLIPGRRTQGEGGTKSPNDAIANDILPEFR
jgi:hypothetical protein